VSVHATSRDIIIISSQQRLGALDLHEEPIYAMEASGDVGSVILDSWRTGEFNEHFDD
jgi:hypothetical protein